MSQRKSPRHPQPPHQQDQTPAGHERPAGPVANATAPTSPYLADLMFTFEDCLPSLFPWELAAFARVVNAALEGYPPHENGGGR